MNVTFIVVLHFNVAHIGTLIALTFVIRRKKSK